ncbi:MULTISPECIES: hypothetical protein [Pseudoalteromonas]|uniref:hypothetical protein n=1 Tax=Pseudoalteromonas TaxID=53246 RepID=UPI0015831A55|nr:MULTISPECIES: hypothetical protein [Pseudoalteromonas]MDI4654238.1 hypothetical protein [Pseudoalteromonas shioyasakiensis]NUJ40192.1 hypothetical protein [Pseudoalteromonas sp. 0303]
MRVPIQMTIVFLLLTTSFITQAAENSCEFRGELIPIGESVFIKDLELVRRGFPRDWQGYALRCTRVVLSSRKTKNPDNTREAIELGKPVLVISELYEKFYEEIQ